MEGGTVMVVTPNSKTASSTSTATGGVSTISKNAAKQQQQLAPVVPNITTSTITTTVHQASMSSESVSSSVGSNGSSSSHLSGKPSQQGEPQTDQSHQENPNSKKNGASSSTIRGGISTPPPPPQAAPTSPYHPHVYYTGNPPYYSYPNPSNQAPMSPSSSPTPTAAANYDLHAAFLQQQSALFGRVPASNLYSTSGNVPVIPLSPQAGSNSGNAAIPPSSPLFAAYRAESFENRGVGGAPPSPSIYLQSPVAGSSGQYATAGMYYNYDRGQDGSNMSTSPPYGMADGRPAAMCLPSQLYSPQLAPQIQQSSGGIPPPPSLQYPPRALSTDSRYRTPSMDEMSLPPPVTTDGDYYPAQQQQQQHLNGANHTTAATLFAHQQQWGYPPPSPSQIFTTQETTAPQAGTTRNAVPPPSYPFQPDNRNPFKAAAAAVPYPHTAHTYYQPPTTPGPPIQTTASNKGPDGANLFIFHIPNHFTNLDMYHLFCHYGTLLSVRIMVEKDTGRSRGFGFVSYDCSESAALAIKELNGFVIGNKRLKVQHKQIKDTLSMSQSSYNNSNNNHSKKQHTLESVSENTPTSSKQQNRNWYNPNHPNPQTTFIPQEDTMEQKEILKNVGNHPNSNVLAEDAYVLSNEAVQELEDGAATQVQVGGSTLEDLTSLKSALPDLSD